MRIAALPFESPAAESARKRASMLAPSAPIVAAFERRIAARFDAAGAARVRKALAFARSLTAATGDHPSIDVYLTHPLRIALFCLDLAPDWDAAGIETALLHNAFEIGGVDEAALAAAGFRADLGAEIRLLTIERAHETDRAYLAGFYGAIEARGPALSLIRCVDKLDNLMGAAAIADPAVHASYIALAEEFVAPMAARLDSAFGAYFATLAAHARAAGPDPGFAVRAAAYAKGQAA
jgi:(p)ppGpp synthase/HD superfamily hydrolase